MTVPSNYRPDSVAKIIQYLLVDNGNGTLPSSSGSWPIYRVNLPDSPDNCVSIAETEGVKQGRYMIGGATIERPGLIIRVRANQYTDGHVKLGEIVRDLTEDTGITFPKSFLVPSTSNTYSIGSFTKTSGPIPLGKSVEDSKRYLFSANFTVSINLV